MTTSANFPAEGAFPSGTATPTSKTAPSLVNRMLAIGQDVMGALIVPGVDHVFHKVGAAAGRHFVEEITGLHGTARGKFSAEKATIRANRVGQVRPTCCSLDAPSELPRRTTVSLPMSMSSFPICRNPRPATTGSTSADIPVIASSKSRAVSGSVFILEGFHPQKLGSGRESSLHAYRIAATVRKEPAPPENENGANRTWHTRAEKVRKSSVCRTMFEQVSSSTLWLAMRREMRSRSIRSPSSLRARSEEVAKASFQHIGPLRALLRRTEPDG